MKKKIKRGSRLARLFACKTMKQVVALLREAKVKGKPHSVDKCPIARYLNPRHNHFVMVGVDKVVVGVGKNEWVTFTLQNAVQLFIRNFDKGRLPQFLL